MSNLDAAIMAERSRIYGDAQLCHDSIGKAWAGLLQQHFGREVEPLPPHLVALMMAALKGVLAVRVYHADNYVDLRNYAAIAEEAQQKATKG